MSVKKTFQCDVCRQVGESEPEDDRPMGWDLVIIGLNSAAAEVLHICSGCSQYTHTARYGLSSSARLYAESLTTLLRDRKWAKEQADRGTKAVKK